MIDWITCTIKTDSMPVFGKRFDADIDGEIITTRDLPRHVESHSTSVFVVPHGEGLLVSGNPSKFLQGHNVFAVDSWGIVEDFLADLCRRLEVGHYHILSISRIDLTHSLIMQSEKDVELALGELARSTADRWGRPVVKTGSIYFGSKKRVQLLAYSKAPEFRKHNKAADFQSITLPPILRLELRLGRNWFQENDWRLLKDDTFRQEIYQNHIDRIRINEMETLDLNEMPRKLLKIYGLWRSGVDLRSIYAQGTLYNYAAELRLYGVDIWAQYHESNVSHFRRTLRSTRLDAPGASSLGLPLHRCA